jgi:hypothetical protein
MDPYLEDPAIWPDVHHELISAIREILVRQLRPRYSVRVEERLYVSDETDPGRRVLVPTSESAVTERADRLSHHRVAASTSPRPSRSQSSSARKSTNPASASPTSPTARSSP